ncbi:MAG: hypothetical protein HY804_09080 [Nitrospinae bacterium]|nr:hypothetical protein [Nitrospinota bacterium]
MVDANVLGRLREALVAMKRDKDIEAIVSEKDAVLARFQPIFSPEHVNAITAEEFKSFLPFQNNRHWNGLQRLGPRICDNMQKLQKALITLLDEAQPIDTRLNAVVSQTFGMGKNIATAILQIHEPARYGVWNNCSEANLKMLGLWPDFKRGESFGDKYVKVNQILLKLQDDLKTDLWTLDALWWYLEGTGSNGPQGKPPPEGGAEGVATDQRFASLLRRNGNYIVKMVMTKPDMNIHATSAGLICLRNINQNRSGW